MGDEIDEILHLSDTIRREAADLFNQVVGRRGHGTIVAGLAAAWLQRIRRGSSTIGNTSAKAQDRFGALFASGLGGLIVLNIDYTTAYEDALRGVVQWNERIESRFVDAHPGAP